MKNNKPQINATSILCSSKQYKQCYDKISDRTASADFFDDSNLHNEIMSSEALQQRISEYLS